MYSVEELQPLFSNPIRKIGSRHFVLCPFHNESTPSLCLFLRTGGFKCFGCGEKGRINDLPRRLGRTFNLREDLFFEPDEEIIVKPIDMDYIDFCAKNLEIYPDLYKRIYSRVPDDFTIKKYKLGYSLDKKRYTIPIIENGICVNIKLISFTNKIKQLNWDKGYGKPRLFLYEEIIDQPKVIIAAGEWDCLLLRSMGFPAVTSTAGENSWNDDWIEYFFEKDVYIVYDQDTPGRKGSKRLAKNLFSFVNSVKIVNFDIDMGEGGDTSDYFLKFGKTIDDFKRCLRSSEVYFPDERFKLFGK